MYCCIVCDLYSEMFKRVNSAAVPLMLPMRLCLGLSPTEAVKLSCEEELMEAKRLCVR